MLPKDFLSPATVAIDVQIQSKKRLLEYIAELFATRHEHVEATDIFERLIERERLGSTGLGKGIALPHARIEGLEQARAVFVRLAEGIDFDAIDNQPVDLVIALLVPANANDAHLQILAGLAGFFSNEDNCAALRDNDDTQQLVDNLIIGIESTPQATASPG